MSTLPALLARWAAVAPEECRRAPTSHLYGPAYELLDEERTPPLPWRVSSSAIGDNPPDAGAVAFVVYHVLSCASQRGGEKLRAAVLDGVAAALCGSGIEDLVENYVEVLEAEP